MAKRPEGLQGYATVYTTWKISLEAIKVKNMAAAQLLTLYSFLSNDVSDDLILHGQHNGHLSNVGLMLQEELDEQISLLLSYSLVKRDVNRRKVSIHPVVHEWTHQHLTDAEKIKMTGYVSDIIAGSVTWSLEKKSPENRLAYSRDILPDIEACMNHVTKYLLDCADGNSASWKSFEIIRDFLSDEGHYRKSEILAELLKREKEINLGKEHSETLNCICSLAFVFQCQGKYAEAEALYKEALSGCKKTLGEQHPDTLSSMNSLASLFQNQGKYAEAEALFKEALSGRKKTLGEQHPDTLHSMNNLASLFQNQGKYAEAEPLSKEALSGYPVYRP